MKYLIKKAAPGDVLPALNLALRVFIEFEAPVYHQGAVDRLKADCIENKEYIENYVSDRHLMYIAVDGDKIVGIVNERGNGRISMLFVDGAYHRQGIATALMERIICELKLCGIDRITLHSSPYGIPFYKNFGFTATGAEQKIDSFIITPMEYIPNEIWDVLDENRNLTGRYIERGRPWREGNYHLVVHVWKRNNKGEWLIDKRTPRKTDNLGGKWETTGGSATAGDSSLGAALREVKEELGLNLTPENGRLVYSYANKGFKGYAGFVNVWVFDCDCSLEDIVLQENETCEAMWAGSDKIKEMIANGEFLGREIYPYLDELLGSGVQ